MTEAMLVEWSKDIDAAIAYSAKSCKQILAEISENSFDVIYYDNTSHAWRETGNQMRLRHALLSWIPIPDPNAVIM